jgi:gliding-associated putative ABC transporter substrate-binding component GldG
VPPGADTGHFASKSKPTRLIVVSDGDVARNDVNPRTGQPQALGFDASTGYTFANQDLLLNMVAYLADEGGLINARNKEIKIRPLDKERIKNERSRWQTFNLVLPLVLLILFGVGWAFIRKKKYASF